MSEDIEGKSGVFYVDGSCRPHNPGYIGWGVHGYFYNETTDKAVSSEGFDHTSHGYVRTGTLEKDFPKNAVNVKPILYIDGFGSYGEMATNNAAEIMGLYNLLLSVEKYKLTTIRVYTDSEYLKKSINEYCPKWEKNGWTKQDGLPISNKELMKNTYETFKRTKAAGADVHVYWIRSHNGHLGNERADVLAGIGMNHSQQRKVLNSIETTPVKGYWKADIEHNPYIAFRRMYFNSLDRYNQAGVYHIAESPEADFVVGKPSASTGYSVVYLNEPDAVIETIKQKQFDHSKGMNVIVMMKLDSVYNKQVYPWLQKYGDFVMCGQKNTHSLELVNKKPVTLEMNPTGLSMRALDHFALLEELLLGFKENEQGLKHKSFLIGANKVSIHDITDRFFNTIVDKKGKVKQELHPEFIVGFRNMSLNMEIEHRDKPIPVKISYALGYDCLPRNNLKYLEDANTKMYLLTWSEGTILKYATIIVSDFGLGIWSNYFANQVLLPS